MSSIYITISQSFLNDFTINSFFEISFEVFTTQLYQEH